jgi:FkbM family methyltransferase
LYLANYPHYDRLPRRLSDFVHERQQRLVVIDVGANIGDTVAAFRSRASDRFLAIEPSAKFHSFLVRNWGHEPNVATVEEACRRDGVEVGLRIVEANGTASLAPGSAGNSIRGRTLDAIVADHPFAQDANVLKIDTDGHDFVVIAGADRLLSQNLPAILFECAPFGDPDYVEECLQTVQRLRGHGYRHVLVYDNFGDLLGKHSLDDLATFRDLLFFQVASNRLYYDVLAMRPDDLGIFYHRERDYFADDVRSRALNRPTTATDGA